MVVTTAPDTMMKRKITSSVKKALMGLGLVVPPILVGVGVGGLIDGAIDDIALDDAAMVPPILVGVAVTELGDGSIDDIVESTVGCEVVDIVAWLVSTDVAEGVNDPPPDVDKLALEGVIIIWSCELIPLEMALTAPVTEEHAGKMNES